VSVRKELDSIARIWQEFLARDFNILNREISKSQRAFTSQVQGYRRIRLIPRSIKNYATDSGNSYESKVQGLINYYQMAHNVYDAMAGIRYIYEQSLVKMLAAKYQKSVSKIYKKL
jgi:hypothetical protein